MAPATETERLLGVIEVARDRLEHMVDLADVIHDLCDPRTQSGHNTHKAGTVTVALITLASQLIHDLNVELVVTGMADA